MSVAVSGEEVAGLLVSNFVRLTQGAIKKMISPGRAVAGLEVEFVARDLSATVKLGEVHDGGSMGSLSHLLGPLVFPSDLRGYRDIRVLEVLEVKISKRWENALKEANLPWQRPSRLLLDSNEKLLDAYKDIISSSIFSSVRAVSEKFYRRPPQNISVPEVGLPRSQMPMEIKPLKNTYTRAPSDKETLEQCYTLMLIDPSSIGHADASLYFASQNVLLELCQMCEFSGELSSDEKKLVVEHQLLWAERLPRKTGGSKGFTA